MMRDLDELLDFYGSQQRPQPTQYSFHWTNSKTLRNCITLAMLGAKNGNTSSLKTLRLIKDLCMVERLVMIN
ncbi:hypothetical protein GO755_27590 [Spirosoma sp. HMF4905]|uniref:Uncharacterized protein n=1 Tax=Spirosoma arboris TaxID=2682092 RepID=A0A7K1SJ54_9BACT|nr:hypothetical protein [Spirosoma arboris]MVM33832.1 hypothetical protein [Spirosoma arboris]